MRLKTIGLSLHTWKSHNLSEPSQISCKLDTLLPTSEVVRTSWDNAHQPVPIYDICATNVISPSLPQPTERENSLSAKKLPSLVWIHCSFPPTPLSIPNLCFQVCWMPNKYHTHLVRQEIERRREMQVTIMRNEGPLPRMGSLAKSFSIWGQTGWKAVLLKIPPKDPIHASSYNQEQFPQLQWRDICPSPSHQHPEWS